MHLSILCLTTPHPGYIGGKVGTFAVLTLKLAPYVGNLTAYHMHVLQIKAPTIKFPIFSSIIEWSEGWDLTDWRAQWVVHLNFAKFKSPPIPNIARVGGSGA